MFVDWWVKFLYFNIGIILIIMVLEVGFFRVKEDCILFSLVKILGRVGILGGKDLLVLMDREVSLYFIV